MSSLFRNVWVTEVGVAGWAVPGLESHRQGIDMSQILNFGDCHTHTHTSTRSPIKKKVGRQDCRRWCALLCQTDRCITSRLLGEKPQFDRTWNICELTQTLFLHRSPENLARESIPMMCYSTSNLTWIGASYHACRARTSNLANFRIFGSPIPTLYITERGEVWHTTMNLFCTIFTVIGAIWQNLEFWGLVYPPLHRSEPNYIHTL